MNYNMKDKLDFYFTDNGRLFQKMPFLYDLVKFKDELGVDFNRKFVNKNNIEVVEDDLYQITTGDRETLLFDDLTLKELYITLSKMCGEG